MKRTAYAMPLIGMLGAVGIAVAIGRVSGAATGSMADWVAATATVAAFGAAIIAARYAAGAFHLESSREAQLLSAQRRSQAALVAVWPDRFIPNWEHNHDGTSTVVEGITGGVAMLRNASDVPVTNGHVDFTVILAYADGLADADIRYLVGEDLAVLPPSADPREIRWSVASHAVMIPGVPTLGDGQDYPDCGTYDPSRLVVDDITFRDAAGVLWHRDRVGHLTEVLENP